MPSKTRRGAQKPHGLHRRMERLHTKPRPRPAVDNEVMEPKKAPLRHPWGHCVPAIGGDPRHAAVGGNKSRCAFVQLHFASDSNRSLQILKTCA